MAIHTVCPHCQYNYTYPGLEEGKRTFCGKCGNYFRVISATSPSRRYARRRTLLLVLARAGLGVALLALLVCVMVYIPIRLGVFNHKISKMNYDRLRVGLGEESVRRMFGSATEIDDSIIKSCVP